MPCLYSKLRFSSFRKYMWEALWHCSDPICSFIVILGWILGKPLTLLFDPFESIVLFLSGEALLLAIVTNRMSTDSCFG